MARKKTNPGDSNGSSETADQSSSLASSDDSAGGDVNIAAYWKKLLKRHPRLIKERKNEELYTIWKDEHPGYDEVPKNWQQGLSNVKTILRKNKKGKRRAAEGAEKPASAIDNGSPRPARSGRPSSALLEALEQLIDDCLILANKVEADSLQEVVRHLRKARREVVWKMQS